MVNLDGFRRWHAALDFAWQGLTTAPLRAFLALLGIIIGVGAVVALIGLGKSVESQALAEFERMGTRIVQLVVAYDGMTIASTVREAKKMQIAAAPLRNQREPLIKRLAQMPEVEKVAELQTAACPNQNRASNLGRIPSQAMFTATHPELKDILGLKLSSGRFLHMLDQRTLWVVLGYKVALDLQRAGVDTRPGAHIPMCGKSFLVAGILSPSATSESTVQIDIDNGILLNMTAAPRLNLDRSGETFILKVKTDVSPVDFASKLEHSLLMIPGATIRTTTSEKIIELRKRQAATYTRFLAGLSSISLLVGALGILNIMLVAVVERRREIGIRMAVGADRLDIAFQFLFESTLLSLSGGIAGAVLGLLGSAVAANIVKLPFVFSGVSVVFAIGVSLLVGITAGIYPALRACDLDPVMSLR